MDPTANEGVSAFSGLKYFRALMEGSIARTAMLELFDINIEAAESGLVVLTAIPTAEHYNPLGFVHGGYAAVLLDTCMAAAIVTGAYRAVNLKGNSREISSTIDFRSKKGRILSFNENTLRQRYQGRRRYGP
jgi:acyl-coenzyme A thioesterase PaaI-like protein